MPTHQTSYFASAAYQRILIEIFNIEIPINLFYNQFMALNEKKLIFGILFLFAIQFVLAIMLPLVPVLLNAKPQPTEVQLENGRQQYTVDIMPSADYESSVIRSFMSFFTVHVPRFFTGYFLYPPLTISIRSAETFFWLLGILSIPLVFLYSNGIFFLKRVLYMYFIAVLISSFGTILLTFFRL